MKDILTDRHLMVLVGIELLQNSTKYHFTLEYVCPSQCRPVLNSFTVIGDNKNNVDPEKRIIMSRLIKIYAVLHSVFQLYI